MPVGLEGVALALDVVSKGGAFTEGVIALVRGQVWVVGLENFELVEGGLEDVWSLLLEDSLGSSGNYRVQVRSALLALQVVINQSTYQGCEQFPRMPQRRQRG